MNIVFFDLFQREKQLNSSRPANETLSHRTHTCFCTKILSISKRPISLLEKQYDFLKHLFHLYCYRPLQRTVQKCKEVLFTSTLGCRQSKIYEDVKKLGKKTTYLETFYRYTGTYPVDWLEKRADAGWTFSREWTWFPNARERQRWLRGGQRGGTDLNGCWMKPPYLVPLNTQSHTRTPKYLILLHLYPPTGFNDYTQAHHLLSLLLFFFTTKFTVSSEYKIVYARTIQLAHSQFPLLV